MNYVDHALSQLLGDSPSYGPSGSPWTQVMIDSLPAGWEVSCRYSDSLETFTKVFDFTATKAQGDPIRTHPWNNFLSVRVAISQEFLEAGSHLDILRELFKKGVYEILEAIYAWERKNSPALQILKRFMES